MSLVKHQWKFLKDLVRLIDYVEQQGWIVTGGELWRSQETQEIYVKTGRSKTLDSYHLKRLAIDLNFFKPVGKKEKYRGATLVVVDGCYYVLTWDYDDIRQFGEFWESLSPENRWGGHFKTFMDVAHFERHV